MRKRIAKKLQIVTWIAEESENVLVVLFLVAPDKISKAADLKLQMNIVL